MSPHSSNKSVEIDAGEQHLDEAPLPTAKYPNAQFHYVFLRVFAYVLPTQGLAVDGMGVDINDLSFEALYVAEKDFTDEVRSHHYALSYHQQKQTSFGDELVEQTMELIDNIVLDLNSISDPKKRQAEGDRLAREIGRRQAAVEQACSRFFGRSYPSQSGREVLKRWKATPPWLGFDESRMRGRTDWRVADALRRLEEQDRMEDEKLRVQEQLSGWTWPTDTRASGQSGPLTIQDSLHFPRTTCPSSAAQSSNQQRFQSIREALGTLARVVAEGASWLLPQTGPEEPVAWTSVSSSRRTSAEELAQTGEGNRSRSLSPPSSRVAAAASTEVSTQEGRRTS
jgi:hypothetical protein